MAEKGTSAQLSEHPWALLGRRLRTPLFQWSFWTVMLVGITFIGYLAVWIEEATIRNFVATLKEPKPNLEPLKLSYATAILAVAAPCVAQLALAMNKMATLVALVFAVVVATLAYQVMYGAHDLDTVHIIGRSGMILALLSWWLANGEDDLFQDRTIPNVPSGGSNTQRRLPGGSSKVKT
jgi:hypothetical protein